MQGWIKLHRKLIEWEWFHDSKMVHLFIYLLLSANHADGNWQGIEIKRGQFVTGLDSLSKATGISTQSLRTCLSKLTKSKELTSKSTNKYRILTLCNYETYQLKETDTNKQTNKQSTSKQQSTNKQLTANKNNETNENKKNDKNNDTSGSSFPPGDRSSVVSDEAKFALKSVELFGCAKNGDKTTLKNIAAHLAESLDDKIFSKAWDIAWECKKTGDKPIALFISRIKDEFNYRSLK
jgi:hypothetical protein